MMQDIEKLFRESLSNAELPYEAGAWEAMSAKLGPPKAPPSSGAKWYIAAAVAVVAGIAAVIALNTEKPAAIKKAVSTPVATTVSATPQASTAQNQTTTNHAAGTSVTVAQNQQIVAGIPVIVPVVNQEAQTVQSATGPAPAQSTSATTLTNPEDRKNTSTPEKLLAVSVPARICSNEPVVIANPNASDLWVKLPGEEVKAVKGKQKATFTASKAGDIVINNGELTQKIEVSQSISPDIVGNSVLVFENGVPQLPFATSAKLENVSWSASVPANETSDGFVLHPYHEKHVTIRLSGTDFNGCKVSEEREITISEPHNLLAPEAFRPEGSITANQFFMPFTLMQRDTPFELFIFDMKNGAQVFSTRDASKGWDGHDSRNGELVPVSSVWVWKVILKNPLPGETPVYSGTITRL